MMSVSAILLEQVVRLHSDSQNRRRDEHEAFDATLWAKIEELGLPLAMCSEAHGGFALSWSEMYDVISYSAACGELAPLGETLIGNSLLSAGGATPAEGPIFFNDVPSNAPATARLLPAVSEQDGALLRSIQIAGALQGALDLSVRYTQERVQFGRPLAKFQAVQHMLAKLANETATAAAAARSACAKLDAGDGSLAIAIAKVRAGRAVEEGAMLAHQIHGAIGVTMEYPLARLSRNMWQWAEDFGDYRKWAIEVGRATLARGSAWETVVAASDPAGGDEDE